MRFVVDRAGSGPATFRGTCLGPNASRFDEERYLPLVRGKYHRARQELPESSSLDHSSKRLRISRNETRAIPGIKNEAVEASVAGHQMTVGQRRLFDLFAVLPCVVQMCFGLFTTGFMFAMSSMSPINILHRCFSCLECFAMLNTIPQVG